MTGRDHSLDMTTFGPPLRIGLPLIMLCVAAMAYAWLAVPASLIAHEGLLNVNRGVAGNDFLAFYSAALLTTGHAAADIFDLARLFPFQDSISGSASHLPFPYPPFFLLYIAPLAAMAYLPALYLWVAATSLPFILIVKKLSGLALPLIVVAPPLIQNAIDGQNGALTASLFAGGLLSLTAKRPVLAGVLFGLLSYKPQLFVLIPICLLAARDYRALASAIATVICLLLTSIAVFGFDIWRIYAELLPKQLSFVLDGQLPVTRCPTVFLFIFHATGQLALANILQACSTLAAWALAGWAWRKTDGVFPRALAFCVALPFATPYMFEYDLAVWTLPAAILLVRLWHGGGAFPDWVGLPLLWLLPPLIWLASATQLHVSVLAVLPLVPYAIWVIRENAQLPNRELRTVPDLLAA